MSEAMSEPTLSELCVLIVDSEHKTAPKDPDGFHPLTWILGAVVRLSLGGQAGKL